MTCYSSNHAIIIFNDSNYHPDMTFAVDWALKTNYLSHWSQNHTSSHVLMTKMYDSLSKFYETFFFIHCIIPFGKFGPPHLGKTTTAERVALPSPTSACRVFSCFRNPPNSDMDYRIFNVSTWSFVCLRIHTGVEHTDSESAQPLWLGKTITNISCADGVGVWTGPVHWISSSTLYQ